MSLDDDASAFEELRREAALSVRKPEAPRPTGRCLNCGEAVAQVRRWCDDECRDDWQARQK